MGFKIGKISMEHNKESKNRPTHIWTTDFQQKCKRNSVEREYAKMNIDHRPKFKT